MKQLNSSLLKIIEENSVSSNSTPLVLFSRNSSFESCTFNKNINTSKSVQKKANIHNLNIAKNILKTPNRKFLYINNSNIKNKENLAKKFSFETEDNINNIKSNEFTSKPNKSKFLPPTSSITENTMMTSLCEITQMTPCTNTNIINKEDLKSNSTIKINIKKEKNISNFNKVVPRITKRYGTNQIDSVQEKKLRSLKLWQKARNFQRMYTAIIHPKVFKFEGNQESDIKEFLYTPKNKNSKNDTKILKLKSNIFIEDKNSNNNQDEEIITSEKFEKMNEIQKEYTRIKLKSKACKLITDGIEYNENNGKKNQEKIIQELEKLFKANPEKNKYSSGDKKFLFNQKLSNGKTLLYIACQEGCTSIVNYFLEKQLDPNIKVTYEGMDDSCLAAASRWGYYDIVKLLLECGKINYKIAEQVYNDKSTKQEIKKLIKSYVPKVAKKKHKKIWCC